MPFFKQQCCGCQAANARMDDVVWVGIASTQKDSSGELSATRKSTVPVQLIYTG